MVSGGVDHYGVLNLCVFVDCGPHPGSYRGVGCCCWNRIVDASTLCVLVDRGRCVVYPTVLCALPILVVGRGGPFAAHRTHPEIVLPRLWGVGKFLVY